MLFSYVTIGCAFTTITYIFLCYLLLRGGVVQNLTSWILWAILDVILAAAVIYQGGNWPFIVTYVLGCLAVASVIYKTSIIKWTWYEYLVTFLVFLCMMVWAISGAETATIAGTVAVIIAGIPQLIDVWRKPEENSVFIYSGFFIGNIFSTAAGKDWSIEERFYPASMVVFCFFYVISIARKHLPSYRSKHMPNY